MVLHTSVSPSSAAIAEQQNTSQNIKVENGREGLLIANQEDSASSSSSAATSPCSGDVDEGEFARVLQSLDPNATLALSLLFGNNSMVNANSLIGTENKTDPTTLKNSAVVTANGVPGTEKEYKPRNTRMKVYADGYFMTFDKESSCKTKHFWRCERKNECPARMHTEADSYFIVKRIHPHNHPGPSDAELQFYNIDPTNKSSTYVTPVVTVAKFFKSRRASRILPQNSEATMLPSRAIKEEVMESKYSPKSTMVPDIQEPAAKRIKVEEMNDMNDPELIEALNGLVKLIRRKSPRISTEHNNEESLMIYVAMLDSRSSEDEEQTYHPISLAKRNESSLRASLQQLTKNTFEGNILISVSPKINVVVHEGIVVNWKSGAFFKLDTTKQNAWKLIPVDQNM